MLDSQLAQLILSDKIDTVVDQEGNPQDEKGLYVKGYSHLSFHQEFRQNEPEPEQQNPNQTIIKDNQDDDSITE